MVSVIAVEAPATVAALERAATFVNVKIDSDCKFVREFGAALKPIDAYTEFALPMIQNPVYITASEHLNHSACPVACATLKAIEVAADLGLKRDVHFTIE